MKEIIGNYRNSIARREFLSVCGAGALLPAALRAEQRPRTRYKAIAFDAFAIFDPRPIAALCETMSPGKGIELFDIWRLRQFEYSWLRTIMDRYVDFAQVTDDALMFAATTLKLEIDSEKRKRLGHAYFELKAWPDVRPVLTQIKEGGMKLALLSNLTPDMLNSCVTSAGLTSLFDNVLSSDPARAYKPHWRAYQLGIDAFKLPSDEILFVAFAGWDAAGARSFGYPSFWANRLGLPPEGLGIGPDAVGTDLFDLMRFIGGSMP